MRKGGREGGMVKKGGEREGASEGWGRREGGRVGGTERGKEGRRMGTRAKPGNQLVLNNSEQIIIDSLKNIVGPRILCLHMFSDTGNTMEDEFCRSAGSKMA